MRFLGLPEIEHPATGEDAGTLYNRVMNVSAYMIASGPVLKDGDTIGNDSTPSMQIKQAQEVDGHPILIIERVKH